MKNLKYNLLTIVLLIIATSATATTLNGQVDSNAAMQSSALQGKIDLQKQLEQSSLQQQNPQGNKLPFSRPDYNLTGKVNVEQQASQNNLKQLYPSQDSVGKQSNSYNPSQLPYKSSFHPPSQPSEDGSPEWLLYISPQQSANLSGDYMNTDKQPNVVNMGANYGQQLSLTPNQWGSWDRWAENLLHMIYANLKTFRGNPNNDSNLFSIYVRRDGLLKVDDLLKADVVNGNSPNGESFYKSVEAISGMPELAFPAPSGKDTVTLLGYVDFGIPKKLPKDVWGRSYMVSGDHWWNYRYSW